MQIGSRFPSQDSKLEVQVGRLRILISTKMFVNVYDEPEPEHQYECLRYDVSVENIKLWIVFSVFALNNYLSSGHGRETAWVRRLWLMVRINDSFLDTPALAASHRRKDPWHMAVRHKVRRKMSQNFCFCWIFRTAGIMGHFNNHETKYKRIVSHWSHRHNSA